MSSSQSLISRTLFVKRFLFLTDRLSSLITFTGKRPGDGDAVVVGLELERCLSQALQGGSRLSPLPGFEPGTGSQQLQQPNPRSHKLPARLVVLTVIPSHQTCSAPDPPVEMNFSRITKRELLFISTSCEMFASLTVDHDVELGFERVSGRTAHRWIYIYNDLFILCTVLFIMPGFFYS